MAMLRTTEALTAEQKAQADKLEPLYEYLQSPQITTYDQMSLVLTILANVAQRAANEFPVLWLSLCGQLFMGIGAMRGMKPPTMAVYEDDEKTKEAHN